MIYPASMTYPAMEHFPLTSAYLCQDCNCVGNCAKQCPACASAVLMSLAGILDREAETARVDEESESNYSYYNQMVA